MDFWLCSQCGSANNPPTNRCYGCGTRRPGTAGSPRRSYLFVGVGLLLVLALVGVGLLTLLGRVPPAPTTATAAPIAAVSPTPTATPSRSPTPTPSPTSVSTPAPKPTRGGISATPAKILKSSNWAGYGLINGEYGAVSAEWTEPEIDCSGVGHAHVSFWVGLNGVSSPSVQQVGTAAECSATTDAAEHYAWYEMYPDIMRRSTLEVHPGDHLTAAVTTIGSQIFVLILTNATSGNSYRTSSARINNEWPSSAEWVVEATTLCGQSRAECEISQLPSFTDVTFANIAAETVDGPVSLGATPDALVQFDLRSNKGRLADVSALALDGPTFDVRWIGGP